MKRIVADPEKCLACKACEHACALAHGEAEDLLGAVAEPLARSRIALREVRGVIVPSQCRHCTDAPCIAACPEGAISREGSDDPVLIDTKKCQGRGACVVACPFDAIRMVPRADGPKAAVKCDLCRARAASGLGPACVEACPVSVLVYAERDEARYEVDPEACRACLLCKKACPVEAIEGAKKTPHVIDQEKCMVCGRCFQVCPFDAIRYVVAETAGGAGAASAKAGATN
ncbi:MAG: 4Fe-4S dicluster domain-containing protein [Planctomycetota bacterium]